MVAAKSKEFSVSVMIVVGLLIVVGLIYFFVFSMAKDGYGKNMQRVIEAEDAGLLARIKPVVSLSDIIGDAKPDETMAIVAVKSPKELYDSACMACHSTGVAGAPKLGDTAAWEPRLEIGLDALTTSAVEGKGAMPPNGGSAYSAEEIKTTIEYMLAEAGLMDAPVASASTIPASSTVASAEPELTPVTTMTEDLAAGEGHYRSACFACHDTGAAGAPKLDDKSAWSSRASAGLDSLTLNVLNGKGAMPPKGGAMQLSDNDIRDAVAYMLKKVN